jgi:hypothetical protein
MIVFVVNHISAERAAIGNPSSYTDFHHNSTDLIEPLDREKTFLFERVIRKTCSPPVP